MASAGAVGLASSRALARLLLVVGAAMSMMLAAPAQAQSTLQPTSTSVDDRQGTDVLGAFTDSFKQLMIEHAIRIVSQEKTRRALKGPFWSDYRKSVRVPGQWEDTDNWWVNYLGHPIHGAAAGYSWLDHSPAAPPDISLKRSYWRSRAQALAWAAAYSLQFEIGPLSEASIGNVGMQPQTTGWVDHVVTPVGAFGLIVAEDALDRYLVRWAETHVRNRTFRASLRMIFNPARAMANATRGRAPWTRQGRPLDWRANPQSPFADPQSSIANP